MMATPIESDGAPPPYRDPAPPCERCLARTVATSRMEPFQERQEVMCPACHAGHPTLWRKICRGDTYQTVAKAVPASPWWHLWWRQPAVPAEISLCPFVRPDGKVAKPAVPGHLHLTCHACQHTWMMRAAREDL